MKWSEHGAGSREGEGVGLNNRWKIQACVHIAGEQQSGAYRIICKEWKETSSHNGHIVTVPRDNMIHGEHGDSGDAETVLGFIRRGADKSLALPISYFPICSPNRRIILGWVKEVRTTKS
jgi:hypothetical protein